MAAGPFTRSVACRVGPVWQIGDTTWRSVSWEPQPERGDIVAADRLLPVFRGELGLRVDNDGLVLSLHGVYEPPAGRLGTAVDAAALHQVAQTTADRFLTDIARNLAGCSDEAPAPTAERPQRRRRWASA